ncbi:MAG: MmgE/PrpD family protein [Ramlibacter sp.]|jgi:2-methylcitrate dehydratase PrpD|nr:MmgE/PrpD family protein [Ramlibacter sp.]
MSETTRELAAFATQLRYADLPGQVTAEAARAFLNWVGCVLGGCDDPAVRIAVADVTDQGGHPQASAIGHGLRTNLANAAFINCLSSTVLSFDDTHLATVTHPTGPVAAAIFALAEKQAVAGEDFVTALAVGMEIECRLSNVLLLPPARAEIGWFITGITGPVGAAAALGRLLNLDEARMRAALGLAAAQAAGIRATHGSMAAFLVPAHAARIGVGAALLAARGMPCMDNVLEGPKGFVDVFGKGGNLELAVDGLGRRFEFLSNAYKPYPSGIVAQPVTDACLEIANRMPPAAAIADVSLRVHPLALELTGRRGPRNPVEAQLSLFHWSAAALLQRAAGAAQLRQECIDDPEIAELRSRIRAAADPAMQRDEAAAEVTLGDGTVLRSHVAHARGSMARPMTDDELDAKFRAQAGLRLPEAAQEELLHLCRDVARLRNVGADIATPLHAFQIHEVQS